MDGGVTLVAPGWPYGHTTLVKDDGSLWTAGWNKYGTTPTPTPNLDPKLDHNPNSGPNSGPNPNPNRSDRGREGKGQTRIREGQ